MLVQTSINMQAIISAFIFYVDLRFNWDINFQITIQSIIYFLTEVEKEKIYRKLKKREWLFIYVFFRVSSPTSHKGQSGNLALTLNSVKPTKAVLWFSSQQCKIETRIIHLLFICFIYKSPVVFCRVGVWKGREINRTIFSQNLLNLVGSGHLQDISLEQKTCWMMQG